MNEIINQTEFFPIPLEEDALFESNFKLPVDEIASLGVGFDSIVGAVQNVFGDSGTVSGLYRVTIPKNGKLAMLKDGSANIGTVLNETGQISGQARLNPLVCDPTTLCMAVALASIEKKLDNIQELQQDIIEFLEQKEKANLRGDLMFLSDIINNYKYNWNNEQYKSSNHIKALDVKQNAEQSIYFAKTKIEKRLKKKQLIYNQGEVRKTLNKIKSEFNDYQLSVYLYAMSSYVEVILLGNFDSDYLNSITKKISNYAFEYRELYTKTYDKLESISNKSIETVFGNSIASITKGAGEVLGKVPVVNKTPIDEGLVNAGKKIRGSEKAKIKKSLSTLLPKQSSYVDPFVETINILGNIYGKDLEIAFDRQNLYIA